MQGIGDDENEKVGFVDIDIDIFLFGVVYNI